MSTGFKRKFCDDDFMEKDLNEFKVFSCCLVLVMRACYLLQHSSFSCFDDGSIDCFQFHQIKRSGHQSST